MQIDFIQEIGLPNTSETDLEIEEHTIAEDNGPGRNGALSLPLAALGFVTRLATGIFSRGRKHIEPSSIDPEGENALQLQEAIHPSESKAPHDEPNSLNNVIDNFGAQTSHAKEEEHVGVEVIDSLDMAGALVNVRAEEPAALVCHGDESCSFKRFDIAKEPLDHYFLGATGQVNVIFLVNHSLRDLFSHCCLAFVIVLYIYPSTHASIKLHNKPVGFSF